MFKRVDNAIIGLIDRLNEKRDFPDVFAAQIDSAPAEIVGRHVDMLRAYDMPYKPVPFDAAGPRARKRSVERVQPIDPKSWYGQYLESRHA